MSLKFKIADWILSKKNNHTTQKQFLNWGQIKSIFIIATDNQLSNLVDFINTCKKDNIHIHVAIIFDGKIEQAPNPNFEHTIVGKTQFNALGLPKEQLINQFNHTTIDVLINFCNQDNIKALAISKLLTAKCKIAKFEHQINDISIAVDKTLNSNEFLNQVIVYLQMIKTTNN